MGSAIGSVRGVCVGPSVCSHMTPYTIFKQLGFLNCLMPLVVTQMQGLVDMGEVSVCRAQGHTGKWLPYI